MTNTDTKKLRELLEKARAIRLYSRYYGRLMGSSKTHYELVNEAQMGTVVATGLDENIAELITTTINSLPSLLDELEGLRANNAVMSALIQQAFDDTVEEMEAPTHKQETE